MQLDLVTAYEEFLSTAGSFLNIATDEDYEKASAVLEKILETASDTVDSPMNPLIDMLTHAIEQYEAQDDELMDFVSGADDLPADITLIKTLMTQHKLTGSDLPEIGDKTMVSKVLSQKRPLSRTAIEELSKRFGLKPGMFFDAD